MTGVIVQVAVLTAQLSGLCPSAATEIARADTAAAVSRLDECARQTGLDAAHGWYGYFAALSADATGEDLVLRRRAEAALQRAVRSDPDNPRWWFALGVLLRKADLHTDALRTIDRAIRYHERTPANLADRELATLYAEKAWALQEYVSDFRGLVVHIDDLPIITPQCPDVFCPMYERPASFHERLDRLPTADDLVVAERAEIVELFTRSLDLDPRQPMALRGLLAELSLDRDWPAFLETARRYAASEPPDPWAGLFMGTALVRARQLERADSAFAKAIADLDVDLRRYYDDPSPLLTRKQTNRLTDLEGAEAHLAREALWATRDPFFLTGPNERRLEHFARVTLAEIRFGEARSGLSGPDTERGVVYVRYGEPTLIRLLPRRDADLQTFAQLHGSGYLEPPGGGRWILWRYWNRAPSFVFEKDLISRRAKHGFETRSMEYTENIRERYPSIVAPEGYSPLPHQVARFRGAPGSGEVAVDVTLSYPESGGPLNRSARAGVFVLPPDVIGDVTSLTTETELLSGNRGTGTFRFSLPPETYPYAVEAMSDDGWVKASARLNLELEGFVGDGLLLSDLLMVRAAEPATARPGGREDMVLDPLGRLVLESGDPLGLYFEVYGLTTNADGIAEYGVRVAISDGDENPIDGAIEAVGRFLGFGGADPSRIEWNRTVPLEGDRALEWVMIQLPELEPGFYTVTVWATDRVTGGETERERTFQIIP